MSFAALFRTHLHGSRQHGKANISTMGGESLLALLEKGFANAEHVRAILSRFQLCHKILRHAEEASLGLTNRNSSQQNPETSTVALSGLGEA